MQVEGHGGVGAARASAWLLPWVLAAGLGGCSQETPASTRAAVSFCEDPVIESWYGEALSFGALGHPQGEVNILGNVSGSEDVVSFEHSLNGGPWVASPIGPIPFRLQLAGDFNVAIDRADLREGANTLLLRAEDASGRACEAMLTLSYQRASNWPLPYGADFRTLETPEDIDEVLHVVDGEWQVVAGGLSEGQRGYYRLLAVGEATWAPGYVARATATVHRLGSWSGVGMGIGWTGYEGTDEPPTGFGMAAFTWVRAKTTGPSLEIKTITRGTPASRPMAFGVDETYVFEVRTQPAGGDRMRVDARVWPETGAPPEWLSATIASRRGSLVLISHGAEVTWHDLEILPLAVPDGGVPLDDGGASDAGSGSDAGITDGGLQTDGSAPLDAGTPLPDGAPAPNDASGSTGGSGGGCGGCSISHGGPAPIGWLLLVLAAAGVDRLSGARSRRARRRSDRGACGAGTRSLHRPGA